MSEGCMVKGPKRKEGIGLQNQLGTSMYVALALVMF